MKKLILLLMTLPLLTTPQARCATGTEDAPLSVTQMLEQGIPSEPVPDTYVHGYIVGCMDKVFGEYQPKWDIPAVPVSNLLLAASPEVRSTDECVIVQLPKGEIRDAISPYVIGNLGRHVAVRGSNEVYLNFNGIRYTDWYKFISDDEPVEPDDPSVITIFDSLGEDEWTMDPYWTEEIVTMPSSMSYVWRWKSYGGKNFMNASGYVNDTNNTTESYLVAKNTFDLTGYTSVTAMFEHAARFQTNLREMCGFYVQEVGADTWEKADIPVWPDAGSWTFTGSGEIDLSAYIGKNIRVAFLYRSDTSGADTWEVRNLRITGKVAEGTELLPAGLAWSVSEAVAVAGEDFEQPQLSYNTTAPIFYESSAPSVASVNSEGKVTALAEGTAIIKAYSHKNGEYEAGEASYTLTVEAPADQPVVFNLLLDWNATECDWTFHNELLAPGLDYVWSWRSYNGSYYLNGSAFKDNQVYEAVAYAISPVISLEGYRDVTVSFEHAAKFQTNLASLSSFLIRQEGTEEWTRLHIINWPEPGSWAFTNSGKADISAFDGKRVQIAFQYGSNEYKADTWEVRNLRLSGVPDSSSGIVDAITGSDSAPRYFDLSGRPVSGNPAPGIYIRVADGKATKVAIR